MPVPRTIDVSIQFDVGAEPITGRLRHAARPGRPFYGWLELASAIEDALSTAGDDTTAPEGGQTLGPQGT